MAAAPEATPTQETTVGLKGDLEIKVEAKKEKDVKHRVVAQFEVCPI